ncbi:glycosyltransferase, partial [Candidatus Sumerlaeota bacterium]|nr:glycosyltransferase [Candidatus Sumerlaeota bacterium]
FDTFVSELCPRLAAMGHEVTVLCQRKYSDPDSPRSYKGVRLVYLPTLHTKVTETLFHEFFSSLFALFQERYDIYYILGCRSTIVYLPHWLLRRNLIINTDGLDFARRKWGSVARTWLRFTYWLARQIACELVSDSKEIKRYYLEKYRMNSIFLTNGGYVLDSTQPQTIEQYGVKPGEYFFIACRIEPENNIHLIVEAFEQVKTDKKLVIAGGANYRSTYVAKRCETKDQRIRFLGPIYTPGHIEELHLNCFAYLHGHEVGGTNPSLLKAMGCGNIVIAHNVQFNAEVLGGTGILFEKRVDSIREKIEYVLAHYDQLQHLRQAARDRVRTYYSWDKVAADHAHCFAEFLKGTKNYRESF